jgi:hypothetical protein
MSRKTKKKRPPKKQTSRRKWHLPVDAVIFFACIYLYVLLIIETRLIYHSFGNFITYPAFSVGWEFLRNSLSHPGGMVEYVGGFLSQLYYFSWLGALVITVISLLIYIAAKTLIRLSAAEWLKLICYIPAVFLLMIYNRYDNQVNAFIALLVVLWFLVVYEKIAERNSATRAAVFLVMFALLYYIAGGACFVFALLASIYEFLIGRRRALSVVLLTAAIASYLVIKYIYYLEAEIIPLQELKVTLKPDPWIKIFTFCLYLSFPLVLLTAGLRQASETKNKPNRVVGTVLPVILLAVGVLASFDGTKKKLLQLDYFADNKMWPEVLRTAYRIRPESYDIFCVHDIDRALYRTGRFGDDMFGYPQDVQALILSRSEASKPAGRLFLKRSRFLSQLGHIGIAERDAFEYLELAGSSPAILEQLATIKMVKGQTEAAKVFLKSLSKDLIFGNRGREMLQHLEQDPELKNNQTIQYMRSVAPDEDSVSFDFGASEFFQQLLDKNPRNKLAFEYLMAVHLLTGRVDKIAENIGRLRYLGYERMPRCYEEAVLIHIGQGNTKVNLYGWQLNREVINRIKEIDKTYRLQGGIKNEQGIRNSLGPDYADSYFLYYLFGVSGARR